MRGWIALLALAALVAADVRAQRLVESLDRGVVAVHEGGGRVFVGWRLLGDDPEGVAFNVYRSSAGAEVRVNDVPLMAATSLVDEGGDLRAETAYAVRPVVNGTEGAASDPFVLPADAPAQAYLSIPLQTDLPEGARLVATGDLDGDGALDFVVKRGRLDIDPSQDTQWSVADTYKLEAYQSDGTFLWRYDLGLNIRPGIWYSPFLVYDLDGDSAAEVALKAGEVGEDWNGDGRTDYRESSGRVLTGPEYLVVLDGATGAVEARTDWIARGQLRDWGDTYGNRANRNMLAVAYLDGQRPSLVMTRGLYGGQTGLPSKMVAVAVDYRDGVFSERWTWVRTPGGAGFQNYGVGDVDGDGRDEFVHGSVAIDDDGRTLWDTEQGHGDRLHMTDIDPNRPGLEVWYVQESPADYEQPVSLRDAATGALLWGAGDDSWGDVGRGTAADIDPRYDGLEVWASRGELYSATGLVIGPRPSSVNFGIWWDGDRLRELLDGSVIEEWNWQTGALVRLQDHAGDVGSRNAPMGYGDVIGDWREEVWYTLGNRELRVYTTTVPTDVRATTWLHNTDYRTSLAAQTSGYMQSTQPSTFFGAETGGSTSVVPGPSPSDGLAVVRVSPNPLRETARATFRVPEAGAYRVRVTDSLGRVVHERRLELAAPGRAEVEVNLVGLAAGVYAVSVVGAGQSASATATVVR